MYTFIVNPTAGSGKTIKCMDKADEYLNHNKIPFEVVYTKEPGHATELAAHYAKDPETKAVIAVGGDGTVAEVAAGLLDTECPMGIIPGGTGNDYRRCFSIPSDISEAIDIVLSGSVRNADTVKINGRTFLNIVTVGFDVEVARRSVAYRMFGSASYTLAAIEQAFFAKPNRAQITIDGVTEEKDFLLFAAGCGAYYGGGINALPGADPYDGLLDVCLIDNVSTFKILSLLPKYTEGKHTNLSIAHISKAKNIKIVMEKPHIINADGDILEPTCELEYQIVPGNLKIISGK